MRGILNRAGRLVVCALFILGLEGTPLLSQVVHAASAITINGSQRFQTIDGFGTNINSASWKNGQLMPALDMLMDSGNNTWRVVIDNTDWEATNDNADPNSYNWAYYNTIYSSQKFQDLWSTIGYINQKQPNAHIILNFMGPGPAWMGGDTLNTTDNNRNEWAEMISSAAYYGRVTAGVHFDILSPANEPDLDCTTGHEGMCISPSVYADIMSRLATKLDSLGLNDLRLMGPDTAGATVGAVNYFPQMMAKPNLMAKVDHFGLHDYDGATGNADSLIKSSAYPTKNFWIDEVGQFADAFSQVGQNASGITTWDGYDSVYNHPLLRNGSTTAPNDAGDAPAMLAYNSTTGTYTPRKEYYQFKQLFKYVPQGSVRVAATESVGSVTAYAFVDPVSGRVTIVGNNTGASVDFAGTLSNITPNVPGFEFYSTSNSGGTNFVRGNDVAVSGSTFAFTAPSNSIFTLTYAGTPDTTPPSAPANLTTVGTPAYNSATLSWNGSTDDGGIRSYTVKRSDGTTVSANPTIVSDTVTATTFTDATVSANSSYTYTVSAVDYAGNSGPDSAPLTITTPSAPAAPSFTLKSTATTRQTSAGNTITSGSFTAAPGDLIVAFMGSDGPENSATVSFNTPTTSGLNWTLRKRTNAAGSGTAEIWTAVAPGGFTTGALAATRSSGAYQGMVTIAVFSGADTAATPAVAGASGTNAAPSVSLTTTRPGSWVWGVGNDWSSTASRTAAGGQTVVDQYLPTNIGAFWVQRQDGVASQAGSVTINDTAPTTGNKWNLSAIEILPANQPTDTQNPVVALTSPADGANLSGAATLMAEASDDTGIAKVEFFSDGQLIGTTTTSPYGMTWNTNAVANGQHTLTAKAYDTFNKTTTTTAVTINVFNEVLPDTTPPSTPTLTANATSFARTHLTWAASTDASGIQPYIVLRDGQIIGTTSATSFDDNGLTAGQAYTYAIVATDMNGNSSSSSASVTMPTLSMASPANGATVSGVITLSTNSVLGASGVQFLADGANVGGEDTTSPYSYQLDTASLANGTHTFGARARDAAGNTTTADTVTVTVNNVPSTLAVDAQVNTNQGTASTSITSGAFSTTKSGDLLVAFITSDGPSSGTQTFKSVTTTGLTWTLRKRVNTSRGTSEIWTAVAPGILTNATVKATRNTGSYMGSITVVAFKGADTATIGAIAGANAASGAPSVSLTTTRAGSLVYGVGNDWDNAIARTVGSGQTMINQYLASAGDTFWVQRLTATVPTAGTVVTLNDTAPTTDRWNFAAIEILPAP